MSRRAVVLLSVVVMGGCARSSGAGPSSSSVSNPSGAPSSSAAAQSGARDKELCPTSIIFSLHVGVKDAVTGAPICDASVIVSLGTNHTQLKGWGPPDCDFSGIEEQLGTFEVTVTKPGYRSAATTVVIDERKGCHVVPKSTMVELQPVGSASVAQQRAHGLPPTRRSAQ